MEVVEAEAEIVEAEAEVVEADEEVEYRVTKESR